MATLIDALVVSLELDPKNFTKGQKETVGALRKIEEQSEKSAKEIEAHGKAITDAYKGIRNELLSIFAILTAGKGLKDFISDLVTGDANAKRFSRNIGESVEAISALEGIARRIAGGSTAGMHQALAQIAGDVQAFKFGQMPGEKISALAMLGVDPTKFYAETTSMEDRLLMVAKARDRLGDDAKAFRGMQLAGFSDDFSNVAMLGEDRVRAELEKQRQINVTTAEQAKAAENLQEKWRRLAELIDGTFRTLFTRLEPTFASVLEKLDKWLQDSQTTLKGYADQFGKWLESIDWVKVGSDLKIFAERIGEVAVAIGKFLDLLPASMRPPTEAETPEQKAAAPDGKSGGKASYAFWRSKGLSPARAAGIVANELAESSFDPNKVGDNGAAKGLYQWHKPRRDAILAGTGIDVWKATADQQREAAYWEMTQGQDAGARAAWSRVSAADNAASAAANFSNNYERPLDASGEAAKRGSYADSILATAQRDNWGGGTTSTEVNINGDINIKTQATDADGIAKSIGPAVQQHLPATLANSALQ